MVICPKFFSTNKFHKTTFQINVRPLKNIKPFLFYWLFKFKILYGPPYTCENLLKTWLILEIKFDLELAILKVKGVCGNFFHIQRVVLHRNTLSNLHDKWDKFFRLQFTLPARLVIDQQSGRELYLKYPVISCKNFAFHKRSICTEISPQLKG